MSDYSRGYKDGWIDAKYVSFSEFPQKYSQQYAKGYADGHYDGQMGK